MLKTRAEPDFSELHGNLLPAVNLFLPAAGWSIFRQGIEIKTVYSFPLTEG